MDEGEVRRALASAMPRRGRHVFGTAAMAQVVIALRAGATIEDAATASGFSSSALRRGRRRSPTFDAACTEAIASAQARRKPPAAATRVRKRWSYGRGKPKLFDDERKKLFLEHFAATLDLHASARAAGIGYRTAFNHRRDDPVFAAAWIVARDFGVETLTDEIARQRLAAAKKLRVDGDKHVPEAAAEFERAMTFLRIYRGQQARAAATPAPAKWSFEESLKAVEEALAIYRLRRQRENDEGGESDGDLT